MLNIKKCIWDKKFQVNVSGSQTSINQKLDLYDNNIYEYVLNYFTTINNYAMDYIDSKNNDLKNKAIFLEKKYKDFNTDQNKYKKFFNDNFNKIYGKDSWSMYDLNQKMYDVQTDFLSNFPEYYLMVKQTEKYTCLYYYAYKKLIFFFKNFATGGSILCPLDQSVDLFKNKMKKLILWIDTNNINDNMTYDEINKQRLENSFESYDEYIEYLEKLKSDINTKGREILIIYNSIGAWIMELQMALKTISLGNIVLTSNNNDTKDFDDLAKIMLTQQSGLSEKYENTSKYYYMKVEGQIINQHGIPIFVIFKKNLKPDYSNFHDTLVTSVRVVLSTCALTSNSEILIKYLPGGY